MQTLHEMLWTKDGWPRPFLQGHILWGSQTSKQMAIRPDEHTPEVGKGARKCVRQGVLGKTASGPHAPETLILGGAQDAPILTSSCHAEAAGARTTQFDGTALEQPFTTRSNSAPRGHLPVWGHA